MRYIARKDEIAMTNITEFLYRGFGVGIRSAFALPELDGPEFQPPRRWRR